MAVEGGVGHGLAQSTGAAMGVPGLTAPAQSKGNQTIGATMVDPTSSIDYYNKAAAAQIKGNNAGLAYYKTALDQASDTMRAGYGAANATLQPLSYASTQALNQQMRMLGMAPLPATTPMVDQFNTGLGAEMAKLPGGADLVNNLSNQMQQADSIQDPDARAVARQKVQDAFTQAQQNLGAGTTAAQAALVDPNAKLAKANGTSQSKGAPAGGFVGLNSQGMTGADSATFKAAQAAATKKQGQAEDAYNAQKATLADQATQVSSLSQQLGQLSDNWNNAYTPTYDSGYTGDQVTQQIQSMPGWATQMQAGTQAIDRSQAAGGLLTSGNTGAALVNYGQGQANSFFNNYMGQLSNIYNEGANATAQLSMNQINQAGYLANNQATYGQAQDSTSINNGLARSNADNTIGTTLYNASVFNATAQNNLQNAMVASAGGQAAAAIQAMPGMMNAQTNAGLLNFAQGNAAQTNASAIYGATGGSSSNNGSNQSL